jgi:hypothetical protein
MPYTPSPHDIEALVVLLILTLFLAASLVANAHLLGQSAGHYATTQDTHNE